MRKHYHMLVVMNLFTQVETYQFVRFASSQIAYDLLELIVASELSK